MSPTDSYTVWSSDSGDLRKKEQNKPSAKSLPPNQQTAYLHCDSKGRGGKSVTLIRNLVLSEADMSALAKRLKRDLGTGDTVKDGVIEIHSNQDIWASERESHGTDSE